MVDDEPSSVAESTYLRITLSFCCWAMFAERSGDRNKKESTREKNTGFN